MNINHTILIIVYLIIILLINSYFPFSFPFYLSFPVSFTKFHISTREEIWRFRRDEVNDHDYVCNQLNAICFLIP